MTHDRQSDFGESDRPIEGAGAETLALQSRVQELEQNLAECRHTIQDQQRHLSYYQTLLDNAPFDVSLKDREGRYRLANRAFAENVGKGRDEIIGKTLSELVEDSHTENFGTIEDEVIASDEIFDQEVMTPAVGGVRPFHVVKFPVHDDRDEIVGVGTISSDLSKIKEAEASATRAQAHLFDAVEALPDGIVLFDADRRLVFCNKRYHELHATVADVMVPGASFEEIVRAAVERGQHPEALGREEEWVQERLAAYDNPGQPLEQNLGDGSWLRVYERPTADGGTVGVRIDISELKQREQELNEVQQRLRDYLDASSDWFWEMDERCRFSYFSDRFEEVTGVPPVMLMGKTREETGIPGVDPEQWQRHLDNLANRRSFRDFRHPRNLPDGRVVTLSINGKAMFGLNGEFRGYRGTGRDISDLIAAEDQAGRAERLLASTIEGMSELFVLADADDRLVMCNEVYRRINVAVIETTEPGTYFEVHLRAALAKGQFPEAIGREEEWLAERVHRHRNPGPPFEVERQGGRWLLVREQRMPNGGIVTVGTDITERKRFDNELRQAHDELEHRVEERTLALNVANEKLQTEVVERERAQEALRTQNDLLQALIEAMPAPVFFKDSAQIYRGCNPAFEDFLGLTADEIVGKVDFDVAPPDLAEIYRKTDDELMRRSGTQVYETQVQYADGSRHDVMFHKAVFGDAKTESGGIVGVMLDITERKRIETALQQSETNLRTLVSNLPVILWSVDSDGLITFAEGTGLKQLRLTPDVLIGRPAVECFGAVVEFPERLRRALAGEEVFARSQVGPYTFSTWYTPVRDEDENVTGVIGVSADVTEQAEAEASAARAQARMVDAIESLADGFALFDADDRLVLCNSRYREFYALIDDIIEPGVSFETLIRIGAERGNNPEAVGRIDQWVQERLDRHLNPTGPYEVERVNGRWFRIEERRTGDGGIVGIRSDITDRKKAEEALRDAEERFRAIFEQAAVGIGLMTPGGRFLAINDKLAALMRRDEAELLAMRFEDFTHREDYQKCTEQIARLVAGELSTFSIEMRYVVGEREMLWGNLTVSIIREPESDRFALLGIVEDITESRRIEEQLRQAQKMEAVGQLTGGVAHDFNNLLTIVLGNLELLEEAQDAAAPKSELLVAAKGAAMRGAELTNRLLAFSRKQALATERIDVGAMTQRMTDLFNRTLGEAIEIKCILTGDLWPIQADLAQLESAVLNLALNARDAMPEGGRLTIKAANIALDTSFTSRYPDLTAGKYVKLSVADSGTGMSTEIKDRAFEPFFTTKETGKGSGLGLSMVYGFARQSDGCVEIESELGNGASVALYLPRARGADETAGTRLSRNTSPPTGRETILVVEDDPDVRQLAVNMLAGLGYTISEAENATQALAVLDADPGVELLFSDVVMPGGMDGWRLAIETRKRRPDVQVLMTSGYSTDAAGYQESRDHGIELLVKPYSKAALATSIRRLLDIDNPPTTDTQRLLVIDDDPGICEFVKEVAIGEGYDVKVITRHEEFDQAYESFHPTTILLDIVMPEVDGIELLRHLADLKCSSRIVAVSGFSESYVRHAKLLGKAYGLSNIVGLTKPFQVDSLRRALRADDHNVGAKAKVRT